jgi:RNA polymerase sigma factor (sigma-70 family)
MPRAPLNQLVRSLRQTVEAYRLDAAPDAELLERFRSHADAAAFEAIVRRHGGRVLSACRQVLAGPADVEDAFQATFLVLLRQAQRIRRRQALGGWLYGVAHRLALRARAAAARRAAAEARMPTRQAEEGPDLSWREACAILHEELDRLPDHYRLPLILCYLEGKSRDEAAQELGWEVGVLRGCLERGRDRLRARLTRRGVALSAGLLAASAHSETAGGPSARLIQAAMTAAAGRPSSAVAALLHGTSRAMITGKARSLIAVLVLAGLLAAGAHRLVSSDGATSPPAAPPPAAPAEGPRAAAADKAEPDAAEVLTYAGRVLGPEGKPLAGAKIYISGLKSHVIEFKPRAVSGPDGRFRFTVRKDEFELRPGEQAGQRVTLGATAPGCGAASAFGSRPEQRADATLWLPAEQIVKGRIVDLEGQPVKGVQVAAGIHSARWAEDGRPLAFDAPDRERQTGANILPDDPDVAAVVSDRDGRFVLRGLGKDWLYDLWIAGPTIERRKAELVARPQQPKQVPGTGVHTVERGAPKLIQYGCDFVHVAAPSKPIVGVVRDRETGKPIAGAQVGKQWTRDDEPSGWTTTDKEGRYRLEGLAWEVHELTVEPPADTPYLQTTARAAADRPGTAPVTCDIELLRRRMVRGRVTDRQTGKPVVGWVEYRPLADNPHLKSAPLLAAPRWPPRDVTAGLDEDGRFSIPVLPGRGLLAVKAEGVFLPARLVEADRKPGVVDAKDPELLDARPLPLWPGAFHGCRVVDVPAAEDATCDLTVDSGRSLPLTVLAPDGKPREVWAFGLEPLPFDRGADQLDGRGVIRALADGERRRVYLKSTDKKFACLVALRGGETGPITARLRPTGAVVGRLVDAEGKPLAGQAFQVVYDDGPGRPGVYFGGGHASRFQNPAEINREQRSSSFFDHRSEYVSGPQKSDEEGRFRIDGLIPDVAFDLKVILTRPPDDPKQKGEIIVGLVKVARPTVTEGEVFDLGEVKVQKGRPTRGAQPNP